MLFIVLFSAFFTYFYLDFATELNRKIIEIILINVIVLFLKLYRDESSIFVFRIRGAY